MCMASNLRIVRRAAWNSRKPCFAFTRRSDRSMIDTAGRVWTCFSMQPMAARAIVSRHG